MPTIIRVPQQYSVNRRVRDVGDYLATVGEECIALSMFHLTEDLGKQPRCPKFNEIYNNNHSFECEICYGTTFYGGVKRATRVWAVFTDSPSQENFTKRGENDFSAHQVQVEAFPFLKENDYIIRVKEWHTKLVSGYRIPYPKVFGDRVRLDVVQEQTIRTGSRYGQAGYDKIGQKASVVELPTKHIIYSYIPKEPVLRADEEYIP